MNRLKLQPNFDWLECLYSDDPETVLIEIIDMRIKWAPILANLKTRKWVLIRLMRAVDTDEDTRLQATTLYLHLYGHETRLDES